MKRAGLFPKTKLSDDEMGGANGKWRYNRKEEEKEKRIEKYTKKAYGMGYQCGERFGDRGVIGVHFLELCIHKMHLQQLAMHK